MRFLLSCVRVGVWGLAFASLSLFMPTLSTLYVHKAATTANSNPNSYPEPTNEPTNQPPPRQKASRFCLAWPSLRPAATWGTLRFVNFAPPPKPPTCTP